MYLGARKTVQTLDLPLPSSPPCSTNKTLPVPKSSRVRAANSPAGHYTAPMMTTSYVDMVPRKYQKTVAKSIAEEISVDSAYDVMETISAISQDSAIS
jgi:hypothetical protein